MPLNVLLIRHGQSEWNATGRWQGQADPPLTDEGRNDARRAAEALGAFDAVVASTLQRAIETAEALRSTDYGSGRSNFMLFLNKEATRAVLASRTARELSNDEIFSIAQPIFGDCMEIGPADVLAFARAVLNTPPKAEIAAAA